MYSRDYTDLESTRLELTLFNAARELGEIDHRQALDLLHDTLAQLYGREAAPHLTEGYRCLHEVFRIQNLGGGLGRLALFYGSVSTRWLTRPLVAFQEKLAEEETAYYMPHIFNPRGIEGRRDLLDVHGTLPTGAVGRAPEAGMRNAWFGGLLDGLNSAAAAFERSGIVRGETPARAARLLSCIWRSCRNTIDFGLLPARAAEKPFAPAVEGMPVGDPDRQRMYEVIRDEIDTIRRFVITWDDEDPERIVTVAAKKEDEDTFTLGPDLREQLNRKILIMISKWEDIERLYAPPHL